MVLIIDYLVIWFFTLTYRQWIRIESISYVRMETKPQDPPESDLDALKEIPDDLKRFDYIYGAGTDTSDIHRFFLLPDSFLILTIGNRSFKREVKCQLDWNLNNPFV
jgi:hypothetical protein